MSPINSNINFKSGESSDLEEFSLCFDKLGITNSRASKTQKKEGTLLRDKVEQGERADKLEANKRKIIQLKKEIEMNSFNEVACSKKIFNKIPSEIASFFSNEDKESKQPDESENLKKTIENLEQLDKILEKPAEKYPKKMFNETLSDISAFVPNKDQELKQLLKKEENLIHLQKENLLKRQLNESASEEAHLTSYKKNKNS